MCSHRFKRNIHTGRAKFAPKGIIRILEEIGLENPQGKKAVVLGRSETSGYCGICYGASKVSEKRMVKARNSCY
ncbi:MAG: hypothetical protein ACLRHG_12055, partial [Coprococcus phoceensis]